MSPQGAPSAAANKVWIWLGVILATLVIVKWASIRTGPSANKAIVAIRVAQRELVEAQWVPANKSASVLNDAEAALNLAWSLLEEKRYEEAILAARKASQLARKAG